VATGVASGSTTIQATSGSVSGSTGLTVTALQLVSLAVTPANASLVVNGTQAYTASGTYSDGSTQNLTASVTWSSTNTAAATITAAGVATGVTSGSTTIQAALGAITGSTGLTVTTTIPGLVGYWTFDDGTGATAADSSGGGNTATLVNGVTWVSGKIGDAVQANGVNQYVSIPPINLSGTNAVTITLWTNRTYSTNSEDVLFEATTNYNNSTTGFIFLPDDSTCAGIQTGVQGNAGYNVSCFAQPTSGTWHHLAVVYNNSQTGASVVSLYIDGVLQTPTRSLYSSNNTNNFGNNPIYLFSRAGTSLFGAGMIDDLRIYNSALSAAEIQQIYSFQ
jgi:hypothetical protein